MGSFGPFLGILWPFKDYFLSMTWSLLTTIVPKVQKVAICPFNMSLRRCSSFQQNLFHGDSFSGSKDISPRSWLKNKFSQNGILQKSGKIKMAAKRKEHRATNSGIPRIPGIPRTPSQLKAFKRNFFFIFSLKKPLRREIRKFALRYAILSARVDQSNCANCARVDQSNFASRSGNSPYWFLRFIN